MNIPGLQNTELSRAEPSVYLRVIQMNRFRHGRYANARWCNYSEHKS